jgi:hypothetical protein
MYAVQAVIKYSFMRFRSNTVASAIRIGCRRQRSVLAGLVLGADVNTAVDATADTGEPAVWALALDFP